MFREFRVLASRVSGLRVTKPPALEQLTAPRSSSSYYIILSYIILYYTISCYVMLSHITLHYVKLYYIMLHHIALVYYVISS